VTREFSILYDYMQVTGDFCKLSNHWEICIHTFLIHERTFVGFMEGAGFRILGWRRSLGDNSVSRTWCP